MTTAPYEPRLAAMNKTRSYPTWLAAPGATLIRSLVENDLDAARDLLAPDIAFCALVPRRVIELDDRNAVLELLASWFPAGGVDQLEMLETGTVVDRHRIGYRVRWHNQAGEQLVFEQQGYYDVGDTGICWMHLVCTGHRLVATTST